MSTGSKSQTIWDGKVRKITLKRYRCRCGREYETETNHWGIIYRGCPNHYNSTSECVEAEAVLVRMAQQQESEDDDQEQR